MLHSDSSSVGADPLGLRVPGLNRSLKELNYAPYYHAYGTLK